MNKTSVPVSWTNNFQMTKRCNKTRLWFPHQISPCGGQSASAPAVSTLPCCNKVRRKPAALTWRRGGGPLRFRRPIAAQRRYRSRQLHERKKIPRERRRITVHPSVRGVCLRVSPHRIRVSSRDARVSERVQTRTWRAAFRGWRKQAVHHCLQRKKNGLDVEGKWLLFLPPPPATYVTLRRKKGGRPARGAAAVVCDVRGKVRLTLPWGPLCAPTVWTLPPYALVRGTPGPMCSCFAFSPRWCWFLAARPPDVGQPASQLCAPHPCRRAQVWTRQAQILQLLKERWKVNVLLVSEFTVYRCWSKERCQRWFWFIFSVTCQRTVEFTLTSSHSSWQCWGAETSQ